MLSCSKSGILNTLIYLVVFSSCVRAQIVRKPSVYSLEAGTYLSSVDATPFWLRTNQYGIVPYFSPVATFRAGVHSGYDTTRYNTGKWRTSKLDIGYGLDVVVNGTQKGLSYEHNVILPEAYVKIRKGAWELYVGRRREKFGLADSTLSSGSYAWSGNALPVPKIQIGLPQFTPLGFTKGWVSIQGTFAHGYLDATGFINHKMLHQKSLYFRLGRPKDLIRAYAGINHQVVWGGEVADKRDLPPQFPADGKMPSGLLNYFYVVSTLYPKGDQSYTHFDLTNRIGNHLGSIDAALEIDLVRHTLYMYRQNIYEDGSLFYLINIADGLNGIRLRRNDGNAFLQDILFEFLNTTSQGGPEFVYEDPLKRGKDDYFNHQQFLDGWSYRQHTIGTPFIPPNIGPNGQYVIGGQFTNNNRVYVFHTGIAGSLPIRGSILEQPIRYQIKLSYSRNFGTYDFPFPEVKPQFSGFASFLVPLNLLGGVQLTGSVAVDAGKLYQNSVGTFLSIRKVFIDK